MPLFQTLQALKQKLSTARNSVGISPGPLDPPEQTVVATNLTGAQSDIASALNEISGVGAADPTVPKTLPDIAAHCESLSDDAMNEARDANPDYELIGDKIKSIDFVIDAADGYRDLAGIT